MSEKRDDDTIQLYVYIGFSKELLIGIYLGIRLFYLL